MRKVAIIEFDRPEGTNEAEQAQFIRDALRHWGGQRRPEDPFFESLPNLKLLSIRKVQP